MSAEHDHGPTQSQLEPSSHNDSDIFINVPPRLLQLTLAGLGLGMFLGAGRGGRAASLRFLAENAHRPPRTVHGWYFYKKTKNYRVILAALREGGREGMRFAGLGGLWAGAEIGLGRIAGQDKDNVEGWRRVVGECKEVGAGLGTSAVWCAIYRLPWNTSRRVIMLGTAMGGVLKGMNFARRELEARLDAGP